MTTPPVPPYGSPDEQSDPYAAPRPHQPPLTPYNPPVDDAAGAGQGGHAAPGPGDPYGAPPATGGPASPYGPASPPPYGVAPDHLAPTYAAPGYPAAGYPSEGYPAPGYPAPGYAPAYGSPYTAPPRTSGIALASMIVSIASLVLCAGFPGIVGLVLGIVGLNQVLREGMRGRGFAITGIVVGAVCTAFAMLVVIAATMSDA